MYVFYSFFFNRNFFFKYHKKKTKMEPKTKKYMQNPEENKLSSFYSNIPRKTITTCGCPVAVCCDEIKSQILAAVIINRVNRMNRMDLIHIFDATSLQRCSTFGKKGEQNGQFKFPHTMCIQPFTRNLLVSDWISNRVQVFGVNHDHDSYSFLYQIGKESINEEESQFSSPKGICCDEKGHIIVADSENDRIQEFDENGQFLQLFGSSYEFDFPYHICFDKEYHQLLISDRYVKRISIWSRDSSSKPEPISHIELNDMCQSLCIDPLRNHQIVIGTSHNIFVYDNRNHKLLQTLGTGKEGSEWGELNFVTGLCVNQDDGSLIVCDCDNHRVQIL